MVKNTDYIKMYLKIDITNCDLRRFKMGNIPDTHTMIMVGGLGMENKYA